MCALFSLFLAFQAAWFDSISAALLLTRPWPISSQRLAMVTTVGSSSSPGSALGSYGGKEGPRDRRPDDAFLPRFFLTVSASASPSSVVLDTLRLLPTLRGLGMGFSIRSEVDCSTVGDGTSSETGGCAMVLGPGTVIGIDVLRFGGCFC